MKRHWHSILLGLIFTIGLFLRLWQLPNIPVGLHGDEASIGYNAFSLLKTGKDQNGVLWPMAIDQFGDFRPAGYHYLDIPFVKIFGLNALAVRLPSALFGAGTVILMYLLAYEIFKRKPLALMASLSLAISPWHINISRATSESVVAGFFIMLGVWFMLKSILSGAFISFFVSFLFYHSARLFVPVFLIPFFIFLFLTRRLSGKTKTFMVVGTMLLILFLAGLLRFSQGAARPTTVSIFNIPGGDREIFQQIGEDGTQNPIITRFLHNKVLFYGRLFLASYFWHFNGEFLFDSTGMPIRYKIPWSANMYLSDLPLLFLGGAILLVDGLRKRTYYFLIPLAWLLIGALPAGLTWEDLPNVQRASLMIPGFIMITSFGLFELLALGKKKLVNTFILCTYTIILSYGFILFYHNYFYHLPRHEPWHRSAATPELIEVLSSFQKEGRDIVATTDGNNNFIFYIFYRAFDPAKFQSLGSPKERDGMVFDGIRYTVRQCPLGNNSEVPDEEPENVGVIFVNRGTCKVPLNVDVLATVRTPDGIPAYLVVKVNPDWVAPR